MSATGWQYTVSYQSDAGEALRRLRREVFEAGAYRRPAPDPGFLDEIGFLDADGSEREGMYARFGITPLRRLVEERGVEGLKEGLVDLYQREGPLEFWELEALRCVSPGGTHSVLDITKVAGAPEFGAVAPLPPERLVELFGTTRPGLEAVLGNLASVTEANRRYQGVVITCFRAEEPEALCFAGTSGN